MHFSWTDLTVPPPSLVVKLPVFNFRDGLVFDRPNGDIVPPSNEMELLKSAVTIPDGSSWGAARSIYHESPSFPVARHGLPVSLPKTPKGENHGFFNNPTNVSDGL
jgi:hypothetical protein